MIGQVKPAAKYMEVALALAPDDRFVLRSATRFFVHIGTPERALDSIWRSDRVRGDPWVQAAELAAADASARTPRWATRRLKEVMGRSRLPIDLSELGAGLATLELRGGAKRRLIRRLGEAALANPTENALAQGAWLKTFGDIPLDPEAKLASTRRPNEARTRLEFDKQNYHRALDATWKWLQDETFSVRAASVGAYVSFNALSDFEQTLRFANFGLLANPDSPQLANYKLLALAYLGNLAGARKVLTSLYRHKAEPDFAPFVQAADGLVCFRSGDIEGGRRHYSQAVDLLMKSANAPLAITALIYWLEQETYTRCVSLPEAEALLRRLDANPFVQKHKKEPGARRSWECVRSRIEANLASTSEWDIGSGAAEPLEKSVDLVLPALAPSSISAKSDVVQELIS